MIPFVSQPLTLAHNFFLFLTELVTDFKTFHMQTEQYCVKDMQQCNFR